MIPETHRECQLSKLRRFRFFMDRVLPAGAAEFFHFNLVVFSFAAVKMVIFILALRARDDEGDSFSHYAVTSMTTPAPTVWPPSRIANRTPFSKAIGVINSASNSTLSPGITISTPGFNVTFPVMSLVRN